MFSFSLKYDILILHYSYTLFIILMKKYIYTLLFATLLIASTGYVSAQEETLSVVSEEVQKEEQPEIQKSSMKKVRRAERAVKVINKFDGEVKLLQNISKRLSLKAQELEGKGVGAGTAQNMLKNANNSLRTAFSNTKKAKAFMNRALQSGTYDEAQLVVMKNSLMLAQSSLETTRTQLVAALESLKSIDKNNG